ncbi:hypothetical protein XA68_18098 [Ophiocordyceps unilateralis]|uniref:Uncharacterized protein n=1 Tax=Ophiocordyceps unilateralis TaxID=268505 RepID=A0A2A9PII1_OPHUN|nr:hypothetical protein XA68_18098 [Ophiocordyceps unilateralis]
MSATANVAPGPRRSARITSRANEESTAADAEIAEPMTPVDSEWKARKAKAERDKVQSRLEDQSFSMNGYSDPLAPRQGIDRRFYAKGVTPELEMKWLARIKAVRDGGADNRAI